MGIYETKIMSHLEFWKPFEKYIQLSLRLRILKSQRKQGGRRSTQGCFKLTFQLCYFIINCILLLCISLACRSEEVCLSSLGMKRWTSYLDARIPRLNRNAKEIFRAARKERSLESTRYKEIAQ